MLLSLLGAVLTGAAFALPAAVLGPDGPLWLGPLPPGGDTVALVDPVDGQLYIEERADAESSRIWDGLKWRVDGELIDPDALADGHRLRDGHLVSAPSAMGRTRRYLYDDEGRLQVVLWANGGRMVARYDDEGRVRELIGPGTARWTYRWANGLTVRDSLGRSMTIRSMTGVDLRLVKVSDALGRTAVTRFKLVDGKWRLVGWIDPRGLETRLRWWEKRLDVHSPGGQLQRLGLDPEGRVESLTESGGQRWTWARDEAGRLTKLKDPSGKVTRWARDAAGRVQLRTVGGHSTRMRRDANGRVVSITMSNGARTELVRNAEGRISSIVDPLGNTVFFERFENGWPSAVLGRNGGRWEMTIDSLGRPDRVADPNGRVVRIDRDSAGRVTMIHDGDHGKIRLDWAADGRLSRVVDPVGRTSGFMRNAVGQVVGLSGADGGTMRLSYNPVGEVVELRMGATALAIRRSPGGAPGQVGEVEWTRDINGRVSRAQAPGVDLRFTRDPAGRLTWLKAGRWQLNIQRDAAGWPVRWSGTDGEIVATRDGVGTIISERGDDQVRVLSDTRGLSTRTTVVDLGEWRWKRDATGRVLTVRGPDGVHAGFDRDATGRVVLARYPSGAIVRRVHTETGRTDVLTDLGGRVVSESSITIDGDGRTIATQDEAGVRTWHRDPAGRVVSIEQEDGRAWSWNLDGVQDPEGRLVLHDDEGRMVEAQVASKPVAWGVATDILSVYRDEANRLEKVGGAAGMGTLDHDALGRLSEVHLPTGESWELSYDARGRPSRLRSPDGDVRRWVWQPGWDPARGMGGLLASGVDGRVSWVAGDDGPAARRDGLRVEDLVMNAEGDLGFILEKEATPLRIDTSPLGFPSSGAGGLVGAGAGLQWFPGGPIQTGWVSTCPVSGQRTDGVLVWPWAVTPLRAGANTNRWDPGPWAAQTGWGNPVKLLVALGGVAPLDDGPWIQLESPVDAVYGLPTSLDQVVIPLGPSPLALPMGTEDPITMAFLRSVLPGGPAPGPDTVARAIIQSEVALPWTPPGWAVPGLGSWLSGGD